jgi:type II secretory pathway component GspD/PulD (secretin)
MWRTLLGAATAICLAATVASAQQAGRKPNEPPREPAAREAESAPQQSAAQPAGGLREESPQWLQQAGEKPWWMAEPSRTAPPPARPAGPPPQSRAAAPRLQSRAAAPPAQSRYGGPPPQSRPAGPRKRVVFRLKNAPADMVVKAITGLLRSEPREAGALAERVALVSEPILNSVLVSAAPEDIDAIERLIEDLDRKQPMVMVQVLIAQMTLPTEKGHDPTTPEEGKKEPPITGLPEKSHFSAEGLKKEVELGVLGASSEKKGIDEQLRELRKRGPVEVLTRLQLMTLNDCAASLHVGSNEPTVRSVRSVPSGPVRQATYDVTYVDVGLQLQVTPRVSPDGRVTMEVTLESSQLRPAQDGDAVSGSQPVYGPRVVITEAKASVAVADGHTIVLGGLMSDSEAGQEELLILLSPHVVE